MRSLWQGRQAPAEMTRLRARLGELPREAHDAFLPGDRYAEWFTRDRDLVRNALGRLKPA